MQTNEGENGDTRQNGRTWTSTMTPTPAPVPAPLSTSTSIGSNMRQQVANLSLQENPSNPKSRFTEESSKLRKSRRQKRDKQQDLERAAAHTAARYYGQCYLEGVEGTEADRAAQESHDKYNKWWLQKFDQQGVVNSVGDAHVLPRFNDSDRSQSQSQSQFHPTSNSNGHANGHVNGRETTATEHGYEMDTSKEITHNHHTITTESTTTNNEIESTQYYTVTDCEYDTQNLDFQVGGRANAAATATLQNQYNFLAPNTRGSNIYSTNQHRNNNDEFMSIQNRGDMNMDMNMDMNTNTNHTVTDIEAIDRSRGAYNPPPELRNHKINDTDYENKIYSELSSDVKRRKKRQRAQDEKVAEIFSLSPVATRVSSDNVCSDDETVPISNAKHKTIPSLTKSKGTKPKSNSPSSHLNGQTETMSMNLKRLASNDNNRNSNTNIRNAFLEEKSKRRVMQRKDSSYSDYDEGGIPRNRSSSFYHDKSARMISRSQSYCDAKKINSKTGMTNATWDDNFPSKKDGSGDPILDANSDEKYSSILTSQGTPTERRAKHVDNAKLALLRALAISGGDVTTQTFLFALEQLRTLYSVSGWDASDSAGHNKFISPKKTIEGTWLTLNRPHFNECLGKNSAGEYMYTMGRLSFDMFTPGNLICSIQGIFNNIEVVNLEKDRHSLKSVPKSLKEEINKGSSILRKYDIVTAFTVEPNSPQFGSFSPNKYVYKPLRGIITTYGYVLPDPTVPNRLSIWFSGGKIEANEDDHHPEEWKRAFGDGTFKRHLQEKARVLAAKLLLGAEVPDKIEEDGSMSYKLHRPIGGHGSAYVDVLYMDDTLRIVQGNRGSLFVFTRVTPH